MILKITFYLLSTFLIIAWALPLIRKDHWSFRVFEFPRVQKLFLVAITLILGIWVADTIWEYGLAALLGIIALYLMYLIFPFTPIAPKKLATAKNATQEISLLISNVFQDNTDFHKLRKHIDTWKPDIILLVETDKKWCDAIQESVKDYPYRIEHPRDNTYGMLFYSKLEMTDHEIRFLVNQEYPSIKMELKLPWGVSTTFYGVHPPPPSPTENTYSTERDCELWLVAKEIEHMDGPMMVVGDLNDVAWSYTTERFLEISDLKDPRKGRGIFATFNAHNILMRWPLDHIFCSEHFELIKMRRLKNIGSDHFPVLVRLAPSEGSRQR